MCGDKRIQSCTPPGKCAAPRHCSMRSGRAEHRMCCIVEIRQIKNRNPNNDLVPEVCVNRAAFDVPPRQLILTVLETDQSARPPHTVGRCGMSGLHGVPKFEVQQAAGLCTGMARLELPSCASR